MTIGERELGASQIRETAAAAAAAGRDGRDSATASDQSISLLYWPVVFLKASATVPSAADGISASWLLGLESPSVMATLHWQIYL